MRIHCVASGWVIRAFPASEGPWQEPAGRVGSVSNHTGSQGITQTCLAQPRTRTTKGGGNWESHWGAGSPSPSVGDSRMAALISDVWGLGLNINWFMSMSSSGH